MSNTKNKITEWLIDVQISEVESSSKNLFSSQSSGVSKKKNGAAEGGNSWYASLF